MLPTPNSWKHSATRLCDVSRPFNFQGRNTREMERNNEKIVNLYTDHSASRKLTLEFRYSWLQAECPSLLQHLSSAERAQ